MPVTGLDNGKTITVQVKHAGDSEYNDFGLTNNPNATCSVDGSVSEPGTDAIVTD
jgi:hypothetical protein